MFSAVRDCVQVLSEDPGFIYDAGTVGQMAVSRDSS